MSGTKTIKCTCTHDFQDQQYGKQQRLANVNELENSATCTVCNNKVSLSTSKKK